MSFAANKTVRDAVRSALLTDLPDILTAVGTEFSLTLPDLRAVYRHTNTNDPVTPCAVVGQVRGDIDDHGAIHSTVNLTVMVALSGHNPDPLDEQMDGYLAAIVRLFTHYYTDAVRIEVTGFTAEEPSPYEGRDLIQTGAVFLSARVIESP